ncbi:unnamed protein product [Effrenium voratum]|nr:unnamed protein product [Effrenium voratum]
MSPRTSRIKDGLLLLALLQPAASDCILGADFPKKGGNTHCMCDRSEESEEPAPSCLLNSDEARVSPFFLEPDKPKPMPLKVMEDIDFFESFEVGECPKGFTWKRTRSVPAGRYGYQAVWLPDELSSFMGCFQVRRCPPGFYCPGRALPPLACGKGQLCNVTGLSAPRECPAGFYCPTALFAVDCFRGSFCPEGTMVPSSCAKGSYCPTPCEQLPCPPGHWCPEASFEVRDCDWWNHCAPGASSVDWYRLGLSCALSLPVLFELMLRLIFVRPVHEQRTFRCLQGMTGPCLALLGLTLTLGWLVMPLVAMAKSAIFIYTLVSAASPHRLRMFRFVLVGAGAVVVCWAGGLMAAVWIVYVPIVLFAGFLFSAPNAAYRRRGVKALCCLVVSFFLADCLLLISGASYTEDEAKGVNIAQGCLVLGHLWLLMVALLFLFYTEIARQQTLEARQEASLLEVEMTGTPRSSSGGGGGGGGRVVGITLDLKDVGLTVRGSGKTVLRNISLEIPADSSCALMGPSGSGKSSLLNVLTGRALHYGDVTGEMFANHEPIPEGIESNLKTKNASGFVPQDDIMHTELTVYENVYFAARLRLAPNTGLTATTARVESALKDVGIWQVKPSVLFLDEPTSGLDAAAAHSVAALLCARSKRHCTTVAVIHQPRWQTLDCFDNVVLLATGGYLVYSGPVRDSVKYFTETLHATIPELANPADHFLDFIDSSAAEAEVAMSAADLASSWAAFNNTESFRTATECPALASYEKMRPGVSETFWTLYLRCCLQVCRSWRQRVTNLCLVALFLCVVRLLLGDDGGFEQILVKLGIAQSMLMLPVCIHSMYVFSSDRLERQREDTAGIPTLAQYLAKDFCHFVELLIFATLWTGIYGPFARVGVSPWTLLRLSVAQCYLAFGISFFLSVNLPSQSTATVTIMLLLVVAQLCSGCDLIAFGDVHGALRGVGWVIFILSPSFYTVERVLPILLNEGCTEPVRRAVCDGFLQKKGVSCDPPPSHGKSIGVFGALTGQTAFLADMKQSYIFLSSDLQLVMLALALRAITLFQMQLREGRGLQGGRRERFLCRLALALFATFLILTIPMTPNSPDAGWLTS